MKSCLIVDDSRVIRKIARQIFEALGFDCDEVEDGKQALEASHKRLPDVVLLDWNMPVMDGLEYLRELRKLPAGNKVVVIFCTTENDMNHIQEALNSGANEYIMKPFDADIVQSKLIQLGVIEAGS